MYVHIHTYIRILRERNAYILTENLKKDTEEMITLVVFG